VTFYNGDITESLRA